MIQHKNLSPAVMGWDTSTAMTDLNGMEVGVYMEFRGGRMYVWMEQEQDRDELEAEFGCGHVWDESCADCEKFGVRSYDDLDELNRDLSLYCGDGETVFFYEDDLLGVVGC